MDWNHRHILMCALVLYGVLNIAPHAKAQQAAVQDISVQKLAEQHPDSIRIDCSLSRASFEEFAELIEENTSYRLFYKKEWFEGFLVDCNEGEMLLGDLMRGVLSGSNTYFHIDHQSNIIISKDVDLTARLPESFITGGRQAEGSPEDATQEQQITDTEKRYINGRKTAEAETVVVGSMESGRTGRNAIINGRMSDLETGEPLIGATIYIEELKTGAVSDVVGHYSLVIKPGRYSAVFNCLGMKEQHYFLQVNSDGQLDISLEKELIPINEVTVKADRYDNVTGMQMGFERLDIKTIKEIPVVMGEKDLLKVAQLLPGVQNVGEGSSGFNVRGSAADQNLFYINKVPVYNPSHLFGFFSSFSPDVVKDFRLYKSNIPAEYGGRLASYFDISTRDGNRNRFSMRGGISPITGHVAVEGPVKKDHTSYMLGARSTYSNWILKRLENPELRNSNANFYDLAGNITIEPDQKNLVKIFGYHSSDRFSLSNTNDYRYSNSGASVDWRHRFTSALSGDISAVAGKYAFQTVDKTYPSASYRHDYSIEHYEAKANLRWIAGTKQSLSFGMNLINYRLNRGEILPHGAESARVPVPLGRESGLESAVYLADEYKLFHWLTLYGGLRYSLYSYLGPQEVYNYTPGLPRNMQTISDTLSFGHQPVKTYSGPELRMAANIRTGRNNSVKLSYNRVRQYLFMLSNTIAIAPADQWKLTDYHIRPPYLDQYTAGFYNDFPRQGIKTSVELYYKRTHDVVEYRDGANFISSPNVETEILQGNQQSYGIELLLKKNFGKLNGWVAYTWSRAEVKVDGPEDWQKINLGRSYPANYDKPHALNVVANLRISRRFSFSGNMVYSTGRPVTYPVSIYYYNDREIVEYSLRNRYRLPDYFRVDLSMNIEGNLKAEKFAHSYWMFSIYNLTGRKNAYSVYFLSEEGNINGYKLSIFGTQIFTVSWNFRFGNYASE